jgi:hypothetical protein
MQIVIDSKHIAADVAVALDVTGREHLVVVAKSTWSIPQSGQRPRPLPPRPLAQADEYVDKPGESAMLYGADFARFKPRCDVLFNACAHSSDGKPVSELMVGWQVGSLRKGLRVLGSRAWRSTLGVLSLSSPNPFTSQPLHYGFAFGGTRLYQKSKDEILSEALLENPSGIGWAGPKTTGDISGQPAPSLEAIGEPIGSPNGKYRPTAFSAIGRHWAPRKDYAGTYDEAWRKDDFPFLPKDYDEKFNQCAPADQQMDYPQGGEEVVLRNMMRGRPDVRFALPKLDGIQVRALREDYSSETLNAVVDTLYFEPDEQRFSVVWRVSLPIRRRLQEFNTLAIGPVNLRWWADRAAGRDGIGCAGCGPSETEIAEAMV